MTHREQASVLFQMHLQQAEKVKAQSQEIQCLSAPVEKQQEAIQKLTSPCSPPRERVAIPLQSQLEAMSEEAFNVVPGTVNTMQGTAVLCNTMKASAPVVNRTSFEDMLAEETNFTPGCQPKHVTFLDMMGVGVTSSTPCRLQVVLPSRPIEQNHPEEISFHAAACELRKMQEPKISKLKSGYSSSAGLIF